MDRQTLSIQTPNKENILYFTDDIDLCTVSDFNKEYINKCKTILQDKEIAEESIRKIIHEYNIAWNPDNKCNYSLENITLKTPSIHLSLTSPGGSVYSGFSMYDVIKTYSKVVDTYIHVSGFCMSMGIPVLCSVPVEYRYAHPNTIFMIHQVSSISFGVVADMEQDIEHTKFLQDRLFDIIKNNTNIPSAKLEQVYREKLDWFITAEEALKYGLISKITDDPIL